MADALSLVKKDLGKDAVILHTRQVKVGGVLGFGGKTVVEITASDEPVATARRNRPRPDAKIEPRAESLVAPAAINAYRKAAGTTTPLPEMPARRDTPPALASFIAPPSNTPAQPASRPQVEPEIMPVRQRTTPAAPTPAAEPLTQAPTPSRPVFAPVDPANMADLRRELGDIKLLVNQVLHSAPTTSAGVAAGQMPDALFRSYLRLLEAAVSRDIADQIIGSVRDELTPSELHDETIVRTTVLRHVAALIPVCESITKPATTGTPLVIALVGPTGVGKTTTIAKLAASYKLRHGKSVGLITSDTYRIAAVDQLRTYAGIIGLPLKVVLSPDEMAKAVESLSHCDVILIDTAGRSQFNADRIAELRTFLDVATPTETHLVLSTTANEQVLFRTAEAFGVLKPDRVILTKLDEAVNFGVVVNVAKRLAAKLSFVTTGQEVPDHIEPGHPERLARMVLDNALIAPPAKPGRSRESLTSVGAA